MKRLLFILFLLSFLYGCASDKMFVKNKDNSKGTSMEPILFSTIGALKIIEEKGLEIVRIEMDLIRESKPKSSFRRFYKGWNYFIMVIGDNRIDNLNLNIYAYRNNKRTLIAQSDDSYSPFKSVEPYKSVDIEYDKGKEGEELEIEIESTGSGHYSLIIFHE